MCVSKVQSQYLIDKIGHSYDMFFFAFCASLESRNYRVWKFQANNVAKIYNVVSKKDIPDAHPFYRNGNFVIGP